MENGRAKWKKILLRILTSALCVLVCAWIFSNSLQAADESSATSQTVTDVVQAVAGVIAPNSFIATATGEDYQRLHEIVRIIAHFSEFALLGALMVWCWRSYTPKKAWLALPAVGIVVVPLIDEWLQSFTDGRAAELFDVLIDSAGGLCGGAFALFTLWLAARIISRARRKKAEKKE